MLVVTDIIVCRPAVAAGLHVLIGKHTGRRGRIARTNKHTRRRGGIAPALNGAW